jgi:hypothetical protein
LSFDAEPDPELEDPEAFAAGLLGTTPFDPLELLPGTANPSLEGLEFCEFGAETTGSVLLPP